MLHLHRKKTFIIPGTFLLLGLLFFASPMRAQQRDWNLWDHDEKPYYFGITLGGSMTRFHIEQHSRFLQDDSVMVGEPGNAPGFGLGLLATVRISDRFQFRFNPQLLFTARNILYTLKYPDFDGQTKVEKPVESVTVTFPFQLKLQSDRIGNFRVYMLTGVKGDIDLASNARAKKAEDLVKIKKYDYGVELGIGFNFFFSQFILSPEIKLSNGIHNLHARDPNLIYSSVFDKIQSRMIVFSLHIEG